MTAQIIKLLDLISSILFWSLVLGFAALIVGGQLQYVYATIPSVIIAFWFFEKERIWKIRVPGGIRFIVMLNMWMHVFGYLFRLYSRIDGWDKIEHVIGGMVIGSIVGILALTHAARFNYKLRKSFLILFAIVGALGIGAFWELLEFGMDQLRVLDFSLLSGQTRLQWGPDDTMLDTLYNGLGGLISVTILIMFTNFETYKKNPDPFFSAVVGND